MRPGIRTGLVAALILLAALMLSRGLLFRVGESERSRLEIDEQAPGYALYQRLGCRRCHGSKLQGTHKAPSLRELAQHFDSAGLVRYLDDPDSAQAVDDRLNRLDAQYAKHEMPAFPLRPKAAQTLASFLLMPSKADSVDVNARQNLRH